MADVCIDPNVNVSQSGVIGAYALKLLGLVLASIKGFFSGDCCPSVVVYV